MLGAIIGDIVGSPYEFDQGEKTTDFPLFSPQSEVTDDSAMTVAVAAALLEAAGDPTQGPAAVAKWLREFYRRYPHPKGGYGGRFVGWLNSADPEPYGSFGNGSAMRVAAVGWLAATESEVLQWAEISAQVTHSHPEGIKGAQAVAWAIFRARQLARSGQPVAAQARQQLRAEVASRFGYDLSRTTDQIRPGYFHQESCQATVPEALTCALEAESFEQALRLAVSLGGDTDTVGAIAGALAEALFGIPEEIRQEAWQRVPPDMQEVVLTVAARIRPVAA